MKELKIWKRPGGVLKKPSGATEDNAELHNPLQEDHTTEGRVQEEEENEGDEGSVQEEEGDTADDEAHNDDRDVD